MNSFKTIILISILLILAIILFSCKIKSKTSNQIAMIMIDMSKDITEMDLQNVLAKDWPNYFKLIDFSAKDKIITFNTENTQFKILELPQKIPEEALEYPINTELYWKNAKVDIRKHNCHKIVYASGTSNKLEISRELTKLVSSLLKITDSIGVYWGASDQVIKKDNFIKSSSMLNSDILPVNIWVKVTGYQNEDGSTYLYTIGLEEYGFREFEIESYKNEMMEGVYFLMDLISYVIENGSIIKDGDTVGSSETEIIKVKYKKSSLKPDRKVISICF